MNLSRLIGCNALPSEDAVLKNPIPALKKKHFGFYTSIFCKVLALIVGQNPFSQRKNLSITGETPLLSKRRNGREIGALVTTRHLFSPNQRRKAALSLPSWLRNFDSLAAGQGSYPGGVRLTRSRRKPRSKSALGIFCLMNPPPCSKASKKRRQAPTPGGGM